MCFPISLLNEVRLSSTIDLFIIFYKKSEKNFQTIIKNVLYPTELIIQKTNNAGLEPTTTILAI